MRPNGLEVIQGIQNSLMTQVLPDVRSAYAQAQLIYISLLLAALARYWDDSVQNLVDNGREMRELFALAADAIESAAGAAPDLRALATDLRAEAAGSAPSLRMTALLEESDRLQGLLARLAPLCDRSEVEPALAALQPVRQRLLDYLRREAQQRIVPILGG